MITEVQGFLAGEAVVCDLGTAATRTSFAANLAIVLRCNVQLLAISRTCVALQMDWLVLQMLSAAQGIVLSMMDTLGMFAYPPFDQ